MPCADWGEQPGSRLGLDIGGTLAKLVYFESELKPCWSDGRIAKVVKELAAIRSPEQGLLDDELSFVDKQLGGQLHFACFPTEAMDKFVDLVEKRELHIGAHGINEIMTTGGGAHKYARLFRERLGVELRPVDELGTVVRGISWMVDRRPAWDKVCFLHCPSPSDSETSSTSASSSSPSAARRSATATATATPPRQIIEVGSKALFPFLLVNIGTGVSVVRVDGLDSFERVGGSAIGGGTFWGLCKLLCPDCEGFDEAGRLAEQGDASAVNLLVEDIYGGDYELPNGSKIPGSITASFFAKAAVARGGSAGDADSARRPWSDASILQALVKMVSASICQTAYLNAKLHGLQRIVFTGNFLRQNAVARQAISENMQRVSKAHPNGEPYRALFLEHEGFFGALGSFLFNVQENGVEAAPIFRRFPSHEFAGDAARAPTRQAPEPPGHGGGGGGRGDGRGGRRAADTSTAAAAGLRSLLKRAASFGCTAAHPVAQPAAAATEPLRRFAQEQRSPLPSMLVGPPLREEAHAASKAQRGRSRGKSERTDQPDDVFSI